MLAALFEINRAKQKHIPITEYITAHKEKTVLVLGDYDEAGSKRLESISSKLSQLGYDPILVKDVPDCPSQDLNQKVVLLGSLSRFVVVDDSSKSGHLKEVGWCEQNNWITILLRAGGQVGSWMTAAASLYSKVVLEHPYDPQAPLADLIQATDWAESVLVNLRQRLGSTYPWRRPDNEDSAGV